MEKIFFHMLQCIRECLHLWMLLALFPWECLSVINILFHGLFLHSLKLHRWVLQKNRLMKKGLSMRLLRNHMSLMEGQLQTDILKGL